MDELSWKIMLSLMNYTYTCKSIHKYIYIHIYIYRFIYIYTYLHICVFKYINI
jgi:hypothetical protein